MNILYTCDDNYVWLMGISTISLFENNMDMSDLNVFLLGEKISIENKNMLASIASKYKRSIVVIDTPKIDLPQSLISARWPLSAFTRLYAGQLLPDEIEKVLYLDCDTIICGSIVDLEKISFSNKIILGVKDCIGKAYKENIGLHGYDLYINAGVLLINLSELRKINIKYKIDKYVNKYEKYINYADQDILNGAFCSYIGSLKPMYDVMTITLVYSYEELIKLRFPTCYYSKEDIKESIKNPAIIHYTTNMRVIRPWYIDTNHPLAWEFLKYKNISPWKNKKADRMIFMSSESKIISIIQKLPRNFACIVLGIIHAIIKPYYIRYKSKYKERRKNK